MPFDVISVHHKRIPRESTNAALTSPSTKQKTFQSNATAMNRICLDLSVWRLSSRGLKDSFVNQSKSFLNWFLTISLLEFPGDGRWRQVIRRCASVADTGVTGVCNWGVYENGVYWEECYCAEDSCNTSSTFTTSVKLISSTLLLMFIMKLLQSWIKKLWTNHSLTTKRLLVNLRLYIPKRKQERHKRSN